MCDGRSVLLHVRCGNCLKLYAQDVAIPEEVDEYIDPEELVQSAFVSEMPFRCPQCEAVYAEIIAYKIIEPEQAA